jgi:hypothetical protein
MAFIRYLAKNISILNVLLAAVAVALLTQALFPLFSVKVAYRPHAASGGQESGELKTEPAQALSPSDYMIVAEENPFHPERKIPPDKKVEKQLPKPELILYGTLITGDLSVAYVDDKKAPYTTPGRGKRPRVLKVGDTIGGFVLKEIETSRITLVRNEEVMTVGLDAEKLREDVGRGQPGQQGPSRRPGPLTAPPPAALPRGPTIPGGLPSPQVGGMPGPSVPQRPTRMPIGQ